MRAAIYLSAGIVIGTVVGAIGIGHSQQVSFAPVAAAPDLTGYAKTTDLDSYAKSSDLSTYAKSTDLTPLAKTTDLAPYAKATDLTGLARSSDLTPLAKSADLANYATQASVNATISAAAASNLTAMQASVPGLSPVQSVNGQTGAVSVQTYQRQVSSALSVSTGDGTVTWTFPTAFTNAPTCFYSLGATSTTYTFDYPVVTSISKTAVSMSVTSHPKSMTISSLTLPILLQLTPSGAPAGTTITFSCLAPQ